jgi:predicted dehydrogenase
MHPAEPAQRFLGRQGRSDRFIFRVEPPGLLIRGVNGSAEPVLLQVNNAMNPQEPNRPWSRRRFLGSAALATAAFQVVPGHILGLNGATSANNKVNLASVGTGGQGRSDLNSLTESGEANVVALCDVDWRHGSGAFKTWPDAKRFKDYRRMLDETPEIDAVIVATPDHTHAVASVAALQRGKHVYCEKPLTHSVWEARQVAAIARAKRVATQMGNQGAGSEDTRRLCELVWAGAIGKVREAHVWTDRPSQGLFGEYWPQGIVRPQEEPAAPDSLDWDLWLGPAPYRPYHSAYVPFRWRGWWDFGTGALGDIGCHALDPVFRALRLGSPVVYRERPAWDVDIVRQSVHPVSVQAASSRVNKETFPVASMVTYQFGARGDQPPVKVVWYDGGLRPPRPEGLPEGRLMGDNGRLIVGDDGFILGGQLFPESRRSEVGTVEQSIWRSAGHYLEWLHACRGGRPGGSNFDWAGPLAEIVLLGNVALRVDLRQVLTTTPLLWDPIKLQIPNVSEANDFLRLPYRDGWAWS